MPVNCRTTFTRDGKSRHRIYNFNFQLLIQINNEIALHPFISDVSQISLYYEDYYNAKLFQYDTELFMGSKPGLAAQVREAGYLTYSNVLGYDTDILNKEYDALDKFIASQTDFIQTDYMEVVDDYLKRKGLR